MIKICVVHSHMYRKFLSSIHRFSSDALLYEVIALSTRILNPPPLSLYCRASQYPESINNVVSTIDIYFKICILVITYSITLCPCVHLMWSPTVETSFIKTVVKVVALAHCFKGIDIHSVFLFLVHLCHQFLYLLCMAWITPEFTVAVQKYLNILLAFSVMGRVLDPRLWRKHFRISDPTFFLSCCHIPQNQFWNVPCIFVVFVVAWYDFYLFEAQQLS